MSEFSPYYDTATEVIHSLYKRGYPKDKIIFYMHPNTVKEMYEAASKETTMLEDNTLLGCDVLESATMPEGMIIGTVVEHLQRGSNDAIEFGVIEDHD